MNAGKEASSAAGRATGHELVIERVFDVSRALVFECWSEPKHLAHWPGPRGFTAPHSTMDFRAEGKYRTCLRSPEGVDHWVRGAYLEIVRPERIVFTHAWEDEKGNLSPETVVTVTFDEQAGKTKMTFRQEFFESAASRDGHEQGWSSSFDRLQEYLGTRDGGDSWKAGSTPTL